MRLLGSTPSPRPPAPALGRTRLTAWLCRSRWSLFPAHPHRNFGARHAPRSRRSRCRFFMRYGERRGIYDDQFPPKLSSVAHGRRCATTFFSIVDGQHDGSIADEETVTFQHAISLVLPIDEDRRMQAGHAQTCRPFYFQRGQRFLDRQAHLCHPKGCQTEDS